MQAIKGKIYSPYNKTSKITSTTKGLILHYESVTNLERHDASVNKIRASEGFKVNTFRQLMDEVADVAISNKNYEMFYRGQVKDYLNNQAVYFKNRKGKSTIYPTICRPDKKENGDLKYSIKEAEIIKRYNDLEKMIDIVRSKRETYYNEFYYSLFQHYDILPTPLIDVTQSLRVAATFALKNSNKKGYVFVFGLPYPNQSISYYADLGIVLIKLQNIAPIKAKRPRYQEGFLVGKYPINPTKSNADDLANRMIAKFLVDDSDGNFWDNSFQPMPHDVLYPEDDEIEQFLLKAKRKFDEKHYA